MHEKKKAGNETTAAEAARDLPGGPGWTAFSRLFGERGRRITLHINGRDQSCELFVLPDQSRVACAVEPVFEELEEGREDFKMGIRFAVKDFDNWRLWAEGVGWDFKGRFFASPARLEELASLGRGCGPALAWEALAGEGENKALARDLLDQVFGHASIDECLLLESTAKPSRVRPKPKGRSV